jgi:hypothetical protein
LLINTIRLVGAIVLVFYVVVATALGSLNWLEKYPTIKKIVESTILRAVLLIACIVLLFGVFQDIDAVREALNVPPPAPKVPPAPIILKQEPSLNVTRAAIPKFDTKAPIQINSAPNGIAIGGGNVTSPTVNNFGPTERHLSIDQIQALGLVAASLSEDSPSWFFIETINSPESSNLASEIKNVLGNKAGGVVTRLVENPPVPKGVFVIVSGRDSEHFDIAQRIANALGESVFLTRFEIATGLTSKQVKVVVESN